MTNNSAPSYIRTGRGRRAAGRRPAHPVRRAPARRLHMHVRERHADRGRRRRRHALRHRRCRRDSPWRGEAILMAPPCVSVCSIRGSPYETEKGGGGGKVVTLLAAARRRGLLGVRRRLPACQRGPRGRRHQHGMHRRRRLRRRRLHRHEGHAVPGGHSTEGGAATPPLYLPFHLPPSHRHSAFRWVRGRAGRGAMTAPGLAPGGDQERGEGAWRVRGRALPLRRAGQRRRRLALARRGRRELGRGARPFSRAEMC